MNDLIQPTNTIPAVSDSLSRSPLRRDLLVIALVLACLALSPTRKAFGVSPPPDGGYPNQNTAEGEDALFSLTTGLNNTALGFNALFSNTAGNENTAVGFDALVHNTTGRDNTANGLEALLSNTTGFENTANGALALASNTSGRDNTATGVNTLFSNTTGHENTAMGVNALFSNTTGFENTATGFRALFSNTIGFFNTATGFGALSHNTGGFYNTANGYQALSSNQNTRENTATGFRALFHNTIGDCNTANGSEALVHNNSGFLNTAMGEAALFFNTTGHNNTAIGYAALFHNTGTNNIAVGSIAGYDLTKGDNNIDIGNQGIANEAATIRIGTNGTQNQTFIAGISGVTVAGGVGVIVDANGQLGTVTSSERFKNEIKPMDKASEAILELKPVTFRYKHELDPDAIPQFGLVAEQVEKVNPDLVARDEEGKPYTVRYEAVNAMLLNEFLKEHRKVEEMKKQIEVLTTGLQKVSDELQLSKAAPQMISDNQ